MRDLRRVGAWWAMPTVGRRAELRRGAERAADSSYSCGGGAGGGDGIRCDVDGNLWASAGWSGEGYDGVHVIAPDGKMIGKILLPEICSNLCFGGRRRNRLFMTGSQSLYAVYLNVQGAEFP